MEALATIFTWILGPKRRDLASKVKPVLEVHHDRPIMWLYALAGAGKSTLAMTTAHWCYILRILAATFFCGHDGDRSHILAIMPTIACQLARLCKIFREALRKAVAENPNVHQMSVASQVEKLIVEPLCTAIEGGSRAFDGSVIIVDALDECKDSQAVSVVVKSLAIYHKRLTPLKIFVTSRPEANINAGFVIPELDANTQRFPLTQIPRELTLCDISRFLRARLEGIGRTYNLGIDWPSEDQLTRLVDLSELLFIFASTTALYVEDQRVRNPKAQLDRLLEGKTAEALGSSKFSPLKVLDALYTEVLELVLNSLDKEPASQLKQMLGTIALAEERLRPETLEALLDLPSGTAMRLLPLLSSILVLPSHDDGSSPIHLIHLSFADFIINPSSCTKREFLIASADHHTMLATHCLRILGALRHNICEVDPKVQHLLNNEIPDFQEKIAQHLPPERQYAVKYWVQHLVHAEVDQDSDLLGALQAFCDNHLLDWLEALSVLGCVHVAVSALQSTQQLLNKLPLPPTNIVASLYDCERIVRAFYEGISTSFFEVLRATSTFAPWRSILRQRHAADLSGLVQLRRGRDNDWSATLTSTETGGRSIECLDFTLDGRLLACGIRGGSIQLRNVQTGAEVHVIEGHEYSVMSLAFSPDGEAILTGDSNGSVKLWDVATGSCLGTWKRHSNRVCSAAWSSDGTLAASGSRDMTVRLWTLASPEESTELSGHDDYVRSVVFAADGTLLSGSKDKTCRIWDTHTKSLIRTLAHDCDVYAVAVSPNSELVACGLDCGQIVLWSKADGVKLHILPGRNSVCSLEFASDDNLAVAYQDSFLTLWGVNNRTPLKVLPGRRAGVRAAAISPDGIHIAVAMGSALNINQWPMSAPSGPGQAVEHGALSYLDSHATGVTIDDSHERGPVLAVSFSPNGHRIAAVLTDKAGLLDVSTGHFLLTLKHETEHLRTPIMWSPSANYVAWDDGSNVCIWETESGGRIRTLIGHSYRIRAVHFTPDEQHVLSASEDGAIRRWN
ncbi:WD40 repeat-like protein, partial [Trametes sanguinea]